MGEPVPPVKQLVLLLPGEQLFCFDSPSPYERPRDAAGGEGSFPKIS